MSQLAAPTQPLALFSEGGETWADGSPLDWTPNEHVTKIVIGQPGEDADEVKTEIPNDLADRFPNLTHLHLWKIAGLETLPNLPGGLKCLDVRSCASLTSLPELPAGLASLVLDDCPQVTRPVRTDFPELVELSIHGCHAVAERWLQTALKTCPKLRKLDASNCPQLTGIATWPASLVDIRLDGCPQLKSLPNRWPGRLRRLGLRDATSVTHVPDFPDTLDYVDLAGTESLANLPPRHGRPRTLFLYGSGVHTPPKSEHGQDASENVAARTQAYFDDMELVGRGQVKRCKLLVLGNGTAGKTCLSLAVTGRDPREAERQGTTHGVQFWDWEMDAAVNGLMEPVHLHVWDFGGQEIYHNTHRLFISKGTVFAVVWNPAQDDRQPPPTDDYQDEWRPLGYWLDFIHMSCDHPPRIAVVCSHHAARSDELEQQWRDKVDAKYHDRCRCFYVDSLHDPQELAARAGELDELHAWLTEEVGQVIADEGVDVPTYWEIAQNMVEGWLQRLERDEGFARTHNEISFEQFRDRLQEAIDTACAADAEGRYRQLAATIQSGEFELTDERIAHTLSYLTHGGWLYWDARLFEGRVIVSQRWALDGLYTILDRRGSRVFRQLAETDGRFALSRLGELAWDEAGYSQDEQKLLLSYMQRCGLCFQLHPAEHAWREEAVYISFEHLPSAKTLWLQDEFEQRATRDAASDEFRVPLLHKHHWQSFLADAGEYYGQDALYARDGFYLRNKDGQQVLILVRADEGGLGGLVSIQVSGPERDKRLAAAREHLLRFLPGGEERAERTAPMQNMGERAGRKQVFVTYAWDPREKSGRKIPVGYEAPVDAIEAFLRDKVDFVRDRIKTEFGDSLRRFMEWGAASDHVIMVHSDKYWRSPDCMFELKVLCDALQQKEKDLLSVVIPVEHLNSNVTGFGGAEAHAEAWEEFADEKVPKRLGWTPREMRHFAAALILDFGRKLSDNLNHNIHWDDDRQDEILATIAARIGLDRSQDSMPQRKTS